MCLNLPVSLFKIEAPSTNPFPKILINPATMHKETESQNTIQLVVSSTPLMWMVQLVVTDFVERLSKLKASTRFDILDHCN